MHCAISSSVLSHLLSFTFKCNASTPLKRKNSLCVGAELKTCHLNQNFQCLLCVRCSGRQCVPAHFYLSNFPQWGSHKFSTVSYFWLHAASRGDKALDVEIFQRSLNNDTICFVAFSLMVPDVQTLCLQSSIRCTSKQLRQCLCLYCMHFRSTILWFRSPWHLIIHPNPCFRRFLTKIDCEITWKRCQVCKGYWKPLSASPPPPAYSVNTSWF